MGLAGLPGAWGLGACALGPGGRGVWPSLPQRLGRERVSLAPHFALWSPSSSKEREPHQGPFWPWPGWLLWRRGSRGCGVGGTQREKDRSRRLRPAFVPEASVRRC